eukprot:5249048-Pyramimonas_sp.AAC.1
MRGDTQALHLLNLLHVPHPREPRRRVRQSGSGVRPPGSPPALRAAAGSPSGARSSPSPFAR